MYKGDPCSNPVAFAQLPVQPVDSCRDEGSDGASCAKSSPDTPHEEGGHLIYAVFIKHAFAQSGHALYSIRTELDGLGRCVRSFRRVSEASVEFQDGGIVYRPLRARQFASP